MSIRTVPFRCSWSWLCAALVACGGGPQALPETHPVAVPARPEPVEPSGAEEEGAAAEAGPVEAPATAEAPREVAPPAPAPRPAPLTPSAAADVHQAMRAAASDVEALRRLIDPVWGIGAYDADDSGVVHHCDFGRLASLSGLGFVIGESDRFQCSSDLGRCTSVDADGRGYAFLFRRGEGDAVWLNAIVQYPRRVPRTDGAVVRAFARAGDGVCALWRSLAQGQPSPSRAFSVFVSSYTGLVPETVAEHHCGEDAAAGYAERLAPLVGRVPNRCQRNPTRCVFATGDEEITVYAGREGLSGVAVTRPGMVRDLDRAQQREVDAFLARLARHRCDG